jgi:uncharacterized membrane protein YkgB
MMNLKAELMRIMKNTVLSRGGHKMNEKAYKSMNTVGAWSIVFGVINIVVGLAVGIGAVIAGAKLIKDKSNITF